MVRHKLNLRSLLIYSALLLQLPVFGLSPPSLEFLETFSDPSFTAVQMKEAFEEVALSESTPDRKKTVREVVAELQAVDPNFATVVAKDEDFWKLSFLLDRGWKINVPNSQGLNLLQVVLAAHHEPNIELVLKSGGSDLYTVKDIPQLLASIEREGDEYLAQQLRSWKKTLKQDLIYGTPQTFEFQGQARTKSMPEGPMTMAPGAPEAPQLWFTVDVPYATNRASDAKYKDQLHTRKGAQNYYSFTSGAALSYGIAQVTIPKIHVRMKLERKGFFELSEDPKKHIVLQNLSLRTEKDFLASIGKRIALREKAFADDPELREASKDLFLYIHGFNVDFHYAMIKTAQLIHDLDYPGTSIAFSWPARAVKIPTQQDFRDDVNRGTDSIDLLEQFLKKIRRQFPGRKIHILAHSLGTRVLAQAMARMVAEANGAKLFGEVILAAPAMDAQVFAVDLAPSIVPLCERVSIFASDDDIALQVESLAEDENFTFPLGLWSETKAALPKDVRAFDLSMLTAGPMSLDHSTYSEVRGPLRQIERFLKFPTSDEDIAISDDVNELYLKQLQREDFFPPKMPRTYWKFFPF